MNNYRTLPELSKLREEFCVVPIPKSKYAEWSGLIRKVDKRKYKAGQIVGCRRSCRKNRFDWTVKFEGKSYLVSRIIYYMTYEVDPGHAQIDHIDKNSDNNNAWNLRLDKNGDIQGINRSTRSDNRSGITGVYWNQRDKRWQAAIRGKNLPGNLGYFTCKIEASCKLYDAIIEYGLDKKGRKLPNVNSIKCTCKHCMVKEVR
jgi:hypothetical protein